MVLFNCKMQEQGFVPDELVPDCPTQYKRHHHLQNGNAMDPTPLSGLFQVYGTHYISIGGCIFLVGRGPENGDERATIVNVQEQQRRRSLTNMKTKKRW